jgi:hypothetical protein
MNMEVRAFTKTGTDGSTFEIGVIETMEGLIWIYSVHGRMTVRKVGHFTKAVNGRVETCAETVFAQVLLTVSMLDFRRIKTHPTYGNQMAKTATPC